MVAIPKLKEAIGLTSVKIILALPQKFGKCAVRAKNSKMFIADLLLKRSLNGKGWSQMTRECFQDVGALKMITSSKHYAWPKSAAALGIGTDNDRRSLR